MINHVLNNCSEQATALILSEETSTVVKLVRHRTVLPSVTVSDGLGDCACVSSNRRSIDEITELEFANRTLEKEWLLNPSNPSRVVIDAPAGYGKTWLLREVVKDYSKKDWYTAIIDLGVVQEPIGIMTEIAMQTVNHSLKARRSAQAVRELRTALAGNDVFLCFDRAEAEKSMNLWVRDHLIPELQKGLRGVQVRVAVAGRGISRGDWKWEGYECKELSPFDWSVIQEILERVGKNDLNAQRWQPDDYRKLALAISRLGGGHPGVIKDLIREVINSRWTLTFSEQERGAYFDAYVQETVDQMLEHYGLTDPQEIEVLKVFSIFRGVNFNTFAGLIEKRQVPDGDPMSILSRFTSLGILSPRKSGEIFYRDAILRRLLLAQMAVKDKERYQVLNRIACEIYHEWIEKIRNDPDPEKIIHKPTYATESIYHALQLEDLESVASELRYHRNHSTEWEIRNWLEGDKEICCHAQEFFERSVAELCRQVFNDSFHLDPSHSAEKGDQEMSVDPGLIAIITQASTLLVEVVRDVYKARRKSRILEKPAVEPGEGIEPQSIASPSTVLPSIAQPDEIESILQQIDLAGQRMRIDTIKALMNQLMKHKRNWNDLCEEEAEIEPSAVSRIALKQRLEDEQNSIKEKSLRLKQELEELTGHSIDLPELEY